MPLRRSTGLVAWFSSHHFLLMMFQWVIISGRMGKGWLVMMSMLWSLSFLISLIWPT